MSDMFNLFGKKQAGPQIQNGNPFDTRLGSMNGLVDKYNNFKKEFTGNPEQKLQELLNSGQMTQDQYQKLYDLAKKLTGKA